jgi:hypothetical protein
MKDFIERCRKWQLENPDWELICDMGSTEHLYVQWNELPKAERMSWIGSYKSDAKDAFEEFATKQCKVEYKVLDNQLNMHDTRNWPAGNTMMIFHTKIDGISLI